PVTLQPTCLNRITATFDAEKRSLPTDEDPVKAGRLDGFVTVPTGPLRGQTSGVRPLPPLVRQAGHGGEVVAADEHVARVDRLSEVEDGTVACHVCQHASGAGCLLPRCYQEPPKPTNRGLDARTAPGLIFLGVLARRQSAVESRRNGWFPYRSRCTTLPTGRRVVGP